MEIRNSADYQQDSGIGSLIHEMDFKSYFQDKNYGNDDVKFFFVVNCVPHTFKSRKHFDSKDKVLYWDIIIDYKTVKKMAVKDKKKILADLTINSFDILDSYKKLGFDKEVIKKDTKKYFVDLGWL